MSQIYHAIRLKPSKNSGIWLPALFVLLSGGILVVMLFGILIYQMLYLDRIYPGVSIAGRSVGGMTPLDVIATLDDQASQIRSRQIIIQAEDRSWTFTSRELGMWLDVQATADKAYALGRQGHLLVDLLTHLNLMANPRDIEPVIRYDTGPLNQALAQLAADINYPPQNAGLVIHPDATVEVSPSQRGRRLHPDATREAIAAALVSGHGQPVAAVVQQVIPAITEADVAIARRQAENLFSQPLVFSFDTSTDSAEWELEPATLVEMVNIVEMTGPNETPQVLLEFDPEKFTPHFETFAKTINIEPAEARFEFDPETKQLEVLQPGRDGRTLDMGMAYRQLETLQESLKQEPVRRVELPLGITPPAVSSQDIDKLDIKEQVSEATSYFKGSSQGRMHNIALSTARFHGVVIPPGEIFSFNQYLGEVTKENGYDESLIIFGNRTTVGLGGGICQVSTTAFRAAFFGGFEIVERWAHGYRVSWYETRSGPGLDATIYSPDVDLRFRNDTDHYLLIQTETDLEAGTVTFQFYGAQTEREVIVSDPEITNEVKHGPPVYEQDTGLPEGATKQVEWAIDGMDVEVTRTVKEGERIVHEDVITSHYRPWQAVYRVGAAE
jgi:vancomycin resistance protein YoaR